MDYSKYYKVVCRCGHVGRKKYVPIAFAIRAMSKGMAMEIAINKPRVKHHSLNDVISVIEIDYDEYKELMEINRNDPYLQCRNSKDIKNCIGLKNRVKSLRLNRSTKRIGNSSILSSNYLKWKKEDRYVCRFKIINSELEE